MADYYRAFGEPERAAECYNKLVSLFDTQKHEMKKTQLKQILRMKAADAEVQKLRMEIQKNDAAISLEPMTGLLNRSALLRVSSEFIEDAAERKQKVGAVLSTSTSSRNAMTPTAIPEATRSSGKWRAPAGMRKRKTSGLPATVAMNSSGSPGGCPMMKYVTLPVGSPVISDKQTFRM